MNGVNSKPIRLTIDSSALPEHLRKYFRRPEPCGRCYVCSMVETFGLVRQLLRDDGTLWLNLGDSYQTTSGGGQQVAQTNTGAGLASKRATSKQTGLKGKDLIGIPWRVAFALQEDGWYLRSEIIWHKPNPMPESVNDRPTRAHEHLFLLSKRPRYFYDAEAIKESASSPPSPFRNGRKYLDHVADGDTNHSDRNGEVPPLEWDGRRNKRSVWTVATAPYSGAHFATFPPELVEPCVMAGTSEWGCCPACGAPWRRDVERERKPTRPGLDTKAPAQCAPGRGHAGSQVCGNRDPQRHCTETRTVGWRQGCKCPAAEPAPCTVLDPFSGACTTGLVALRLGRRFIGIDLNGDYLEMGRKRLDDAGLLANLFYPREPTP